MPVADAGNGDTDAGTRVAELTAVTAVESGTLTARNLMVDVAGSATGTVALDGDPASPDAAAGR